MYVQFNHLVSSTQPRLFSCQVDQYNQFLLQEDVSLFGLYEFVIN